MFMLGSETDVNRQQTMMNSLQEDQSSDLEFIMDFLEEYYRHNIEGDGIEKVEDVCWTRNMPVEETYCEQHWTCYEPTQFTRPDLQPEPSQDPAMMLDQNTATLSACGPVPNLVPERQSSKHHAKGAGSGRKVRLFHFLYEMLEDPGMADCVSWVPAATGMFRFSSRNKDQVAALWGQRKGNKRPMTYQKMSRALRNYTRSGEILKVKKKLTYQFSRDTLRSLQRCH